MTVRTFSTPKATMWTILLIPATLLLTSCAAPQRVLVVADESDLQRGLTIQQVERILGEPFDDVGYVGGYSRVETRKYLSVQSNRVYQITYRNGVLDEIIWVDASEEIEKVRAELNSTIQLGQNKERVRQIIGHPTYVTGDEFDTLWWYYVSDEEIYLLRFKDNSLINGVKTTAPILRQYIKQYQQM